MNVLSWDGKWVQGFKPLQAGAQVGGRGQGILIPRVLKYFAKCDDIDSRSKGMDMQPWGAFGFYGRGHENLWIPLQCMESKNRVLLGCLFYGFVWGINKKRVGRKNAWGVPTWI